MEKLTSLKRRTRDIQFQVFLEETNSESIPQQLLIVLEELTLSF